MMGILFYLIVAGVTVGIFCAIIIPIAKKDSERLEYYKQQVPKENICALKSFKYEEDESLGKKMYIGTGLVVDINKNEKNVKVTLMFYNNPRAEVYLQTIKLTLDEYNQKGFNKLDYIKCVMKYNKDMFVYELKKIM